MSSSDVHRRPDAPSYSSDVRQQAKAAAASRHARVERLAGHSQVARWLRERGFQDRPPLGGSRTFMGLMFYQVAAPRPYPSLLNAAL